MKFRVMDYRVNLLIFVNRWFLYGASQHDINYFTRFIL
jgi:hypothetical protein